MDWRNWIFSVFSGFLTQVPLCRRWPCFTILSMQISRLSAISRRRHPSRAPVWLFLIGLKFPEERAFHCFVRLGF